MSSLSHIVEPTGLLLLWHPTSLDSERPTRRIVGKIFADLSGVTVFRYLRDDDDFDIACTQGFKGFPAFDLKKGEIREGVVSALLRRLPPRNREDFDRFLEQHGLPVPFPYSDLALLAYTGARLPSDGFCVVPIFPDSIPKCDYVTEIAGFVYAYEGNISSIKVDDSVQLSTEPNNKVDSDAVAIHWGSKKLGYVNRGLRHTINDWLRSRVVSASIFRVHEATQRRHVL